MKHAESFNKWKKKKKAKATTEIEVRLDSEMEWNPNRLELLRNYYGSSIQLVSMPRIISVISVIYIYIFGLKTLEIFFSKTQTVFSSVQLLSHVWLCHPMNHSMPGLPIHHQLPESTQTYVHCVGDAIQPSHPLPSPSPPAPNPSQHQGLFQWVSSSHQVAKVLEY